MHKHSDHDLVDLVVLEAELITNVGSGIAQETTEFLESAFLLFGRTGLRRRHFSLPVHALAFLGMSSRRRLQSAPAVSILSAMLMLVGVERFSDHLRREQQVVIVDDDEVSRLVDLGDFVGKELVHLHITDPRWVGSGKSRRRVEPKEVVEQRPERCFDQ